MPDESGAYFSEDRSAEVVIARMGGCEDPRLHAVMSAVIRHLHAAVKEVEPTYEEWLAAIQFLTRAGQMCDDKRQEFILLSDVLGVSMLVDAINTRRPTGATENTVLGPFHVDGAPDQAPGDSISRDGLGEPLLVTGRVTDTDGVPVADAVIDTWQASHDGFYDVQQPGVQPDHNLRGVFRTDADGRFWFRSVKPVRYGIPDDGPVGAMLNSLKRGNVRPAHLHFIVAAPGYETVTTHIFVDGDDYLDQDAVFGVKESLVRRFEQVDDPARAKELGLRNPFWTVTSDFVLTKSNPTGEPS